MCLDKYSFNTQPPKGGWHDDAGGIAASIAVSTHSRLKAAAWRFHLFSLRAAVSTHSRLKAAAALEDEIEYLVMFQHTAA